MEVGAGGVAQQRQGKRARASTEGGLGSRRGNVVHWGWGGMSVRTMCEIGGVARGVAQHAMRIASRKMPVATKFISRDELC